MKKLELIDGEYLLAPLLDVHERFNQKHDLTLTMSYDDETDPNRRNWIDVTVPIVRLVEIINVIKTLKTSDDQLPLVKQISNSNDPIDKAIWTYMNSDSAEVGWNLLYQLWDIVKEGNLSQMRHFVVNMYIKQANTGITEIISTEEADIELVIKSFKDEQLAEWDSIEIRYFELPETIAAKVKDEINDPNWMSDECETAHYTVNETTYTVLELLRLGDVVSFTINQS